MNNNNSGVNTILLVLILILGVGALVWYVNGNRGVSEQPADTIEVNIPVPDMVDGEAGVNN